MKTLIKDILLSLSGLGLGVICIIITFVISKRNGVKKRLFDERYRKINYQAKAISWNVTFVVLLLAWAVVIVVEGISFSFFLITALYVAHCLSLIFSSLYANRQN